MANVNFDIQITGVKELLNKCEQYSMGMEQMQQYVITDVSLADMYCKQQIPIGATGELTSSITNSYKFNASEISAEIVANSTHAKYVEFGTGVVGQSSPHPDAGNSNWQYNVPSKYKDSTGGWKWFDTKITHKKQYTHGMGSRPFMYKTAQWLNNKLIKTILGVFNR